MDDLISRQAAIDVLRNRWLKTRNYEGIGEDIAEECEIYLKTLPSAQPDVTGINVGDMVSRQAAIDAQPDKDKVSNLLYHIYSIQSPHLDVSGVVAKKYYCEELWKELFGKESELPRWMT